MPRLLLALSFLTAIGLPARSQCVEGWLPGTELPGLAGGTAFVVSAYALLPFDPDGAGPAPEVLVAGGNFTNAGAASSVGNIAAWNGAAWTAFGAGMNANATGDSVRALAIHNGQLIAGGYFTTAGGVPANGVARWNGTAWTALGPGISGVRSLAVYNGSLYAGGDFGIRRWTNVIWTQVGAGIVGSPVHALLVHNGELIAGGNFTTAGGTPANRIARWNGATWTTFGTGMDATVSALCTYNGELFAGGSFVNAGGITASKIARWDGASWQPCGTGMPASSNYAVLALSTLGGELVAGGTFPTANGVSVQNIARWNGVGWTDLDSGTNGAITALAVHAGDLVAGGAFTSAGTAVAGRAARFDGATWRPLGSAAGLPIPVSSLASEGSELVASASGNSGTLNVMVHDGIRWSAIGSGLGVYAVLPLPPAGPIVGSVTHYNGEIIAGGTFTITGQSGGGIARRSGNTWQSLGNSNFQGCSDLYVHNGDLYIGLGYTVKRWNGTAWQTVGIAGNGGVTAIAAYNGELIVCGEFTTFAGVSASGIVRWNGSVWQPLGLGVSASGISSAIIRALAVHSGALFAAGSFAFAGGAPANNIARWDGSSWAPLGSGISGPVYSLLSTNGGLIAAGSIATAGSVTVNNIGRWDGATWNALGSGVNGPVYALAAHDGTVVAGGQFTTAGPYAASNLARWAQPVPGITITQPGGIGTGVFLNDSGLVPGHEYYNIYSPEPCLAGPGAGPYLGLCFTDFSVPLWELAQPVGAAPIHILASGTSMSFGPFILPSSLTVDLICLDVTGGAFGCVSPVVRYTVP